MSLKIEDKDGQSPTPPGGLVADRRLYLTRDGNRVVEHGSAEIATLLATPDTLIPKEEVDRLGLRSVRGRIVLPGTKPAAAGEAEKNEEDGEEEASASESPDKEAKTSRKPKGKGASD